MSCSIRPSQWDVIFLDFSKAFDTVPHNELLFKLGLAGDLWLMAEELFIKQISVRLHWGFSIRVTTCGFWCPPREHLGASPFLVFVNDLPAVVRHSTLLMFADELIKYVHRDLRVLISSDLSFDEHYLHIVSRSYPSSKDILFMLEQHGEKPSIYLPSEVATNVLLSCVATPILFSWETCNEVRFPVRLQDKAA